MPHFQDDIWLGAAPGPQTGGAFPGVTGAGFRGVGPLGRVFVYDITPAALATNNICTSQTVSTANAVINGAAATGGVATLDVARTLQMAAAAGNTSNVTVTGRDIYGQVMTETRALNGTTPVNFLKAFRTITQVFVNGSVTTFTLGTRDVFGLPYRVTDAGYIVHVGWDNTLARNAGTFTAADTTSPATATTGDVRGTYAITGNAANGTRRLVMTIAIPAIGSGPDATQTGAIGVPQA